MEKIKLKFLIITAYSSKEISNLKGEDELFIEKEQLVNQLSIPCAFSPLYYNDNGIGLITTGIGIANASASIMAVGLSEKIDLTDTNIFIAGVAGLMPGKGPLGTVVLVSNVINGLCFEIDPRELEESKEFYKEELPWITDTEVFKLNYDRLKIFHSIIKEKTDINAVIGGNLTGDYFWHGKRLASWADNWVKKWTGNKDSFYVSDMENSGILTSLKRLSKAGRCSFDNVTVIRTASNYVYEPLLSAAESIRKHDNDYFILAVENTYKAIRTIMSEIS